MSIYIYLLIVTYSVITVVGLLNASLWRDGPSYWPAGRFMALMLGGQGVYFLCLGVMYWISPDTPFFAGERLPLYHLIIAFITLLVLLWCMGVILRVNRGVDKGGSTIPVDYSGKVDGPEERAWYDDETD